MHSWMNIFVLSSLLVLFISPKNMRLLLLSSSFETETKLFDLRSLPHGYLTFLGDSHFRYNAIVLTKEGTQTDAPRSSGVVLYSRPILFLDPHSKKVPSFYTAFAFSIENIHGDEEASGDGLAFLISSHNDFIGSPGYLGLVDSAGLTKDKFIAIEFDTRCDSMFRDPDDNHVGLDINSLYSVNLATSSSLGLNLKNTDLIRTWVYYKGNEKRLEVFLSDSISKPKKPLLRIDIDLSNHLKESMFVGFSAATNGSMQLARIHQWEFAITDFSPPPPPPSLPESGGTFPNPSESGRKHSYLSRCAIGLVVGVFFVAFVIPLSRYCWNKLMQIIQKVEVTNNTETQTVKSSGKISCQEIRLHTLVDEVARGFNITKVLDNDVELSRVKTVKSSFSPYDSLRKVGLPLRTNDVTPVC